MIGLKNLMDHVTWPRPFQGWFVIHVIKFAMVNLRAKFEVFNSAGYDDMIADAKYRKWGGLG